MMIKHIITEAEYSAVKEKIKVTMHKRVERRLRVIMLRYEGKTDKEIAEKLDYHYKRITQLFREYKRDGLERYACHKYGGNNQVLSFEEEQEIIDSFAQKAESGQIICAWQMKPTFDEKLGRDTGRGYIYEVLARHKWRKVMPRSRHPQKASEEAIEASKKLTIGTMK